MTDYSTLPVWGRVVRLRDCTVADADMLDQWNRDMDVGSFNDFGPRQPVPREVLANGTLRNERNGSLIIERLPEGEPVGTIGWPDVRRAPDRH